ncbi:MAG: TonB-dependent receptor, partial [Methylococcaceae bacterium]|nr:TonB-dependent receptor [Methylococcaceae bacterium]
MLTEETPTETYATSLYLTGKFDTWGLRHTLLSGMDYFNSRIEFDQVRFSFIPSIDIFNPIHGGEIGSFLSRFEENRKEYWYGFYLQDQVELPYHFHLLAGFRYDNTTSRLLRDDFPTADAHSPNRSTKIEIHNEPVKPRFGLLWQPIPALSLYGNYVENFGLPNQFSLSAGNTQLLPQTAQQWEVGLKTELFDGRLTGTLAWYNLTKQNIATSDPFNPGFSMLTGEARNRGLELD